MKNDFNKATLHPKVDTKINRDNQTRETSSNRKRNRTSDSKPETPRYRATIDGEIGRRKSITQHMKRDLNKNLSEQLPPSGLLFTFYPNQ